jgi:hypothetical protein
MSDRHPDQLGLFETRVYPERIEAGSVDLDRFRSEIKRAMSRAIRESGYDRQTVALRMAQYLGLPNLSKTTLDAYTAESKDSHDISLLRFSAFVHATGAKWLFDLVVAKAGMTALEGSEAKLAEIARLDQERRSINAELRKLRARPVKPKDWRRRS